MYFKIGFITFNDMLNLVYIKIIKNQLKEWGCKYNSLRVGDKPHYDVWVDDKAIWSEDFFKNDN